MNVLDTLENLLNQTAFMSLTPGNYIMILVACVFLYLAIKKGYEPLLLVPIAFGMLLVNMYPDIMLHPEDSANGTGGLLYYFYILDEWSILPSLIFLGVGAMTDFGPLIANPKSFLLGAAAQFGIYSAYFLAIFMGFGGKAAAAISIIGGADGPTSIFLAGKLGQTALMGPIAVAAYSYMALVPIIQPPIMKALTTEKERKVKMEQLRPVSKLEKILFPIVVTIVVVMILPTTAPLVGMLMLGNLFRESGVVKQLQETASNALMYIVVILLGTSDDSEKLYFLNDNKASLIDVNYNKDNNYYLIDDGTYLVEVDKDSYFVYDVINNAKVYSSNKDYSNYVFFKTKYMCSDKDGNTIFGDFLTGEVRTILESKKKSVRVDKFMSSSDNYSVVVLLDDNKNTFYIFYL